MGDCQQEKKVNASPEPISLEGIQNILNQMKASVCRIYNIHEGTGYFTKIPFNNKLIPVLITNNHVIDEKIIISKKEIPIYLNQKLRTIKIDEKRKRYTNKKLDITIIELKEEDNIKEYLELDDNIITYFFSNEKRNNPNYINETYLNKSIYILNNYEGNGIMASFGEPPKIKNWEINHKCNTEEGSSGSPILLIKNQKLIGVHFGYSKTYELNKGALIIYSIIEFQNIKNNLLVINKEGKDISNEINSYIITEFDIKEDNKNIKIINSFEQSKKEGYINYLGEGLENEEEIKKCEISINDEIIPFCYDYKFNKRGKYKIEYRFKEKIRKIDFMFCGCSSLTSINLSNFFTQNIINMVCIFFKCSSLTNINLSNFNAQNVNDIHSMFKGCSSLTSINLSNFSTQNITNMGNMFSGCSSLTSINFSNFNTQNVTNMKDMFYNCSCLTNIDLSDFKTQNVINMGDMFFNCSSLTNINLSNFNTQNVTNMSCMFYGCSYLANINISEFNTQNVTNMGSMFRGCSSLININISNFNTQKVTNMKDMFRGCSSLTDINMSNFDTQNVTDMSDMFCKCYSLSNINLSHFKTENVKYMNEMFRECSSLTSLNLYNFNTQKVTNMCHMYKECYKLRKKNVITFDKKLLNQIKNDLED